MQARVWDGKQVPSNATLAPWKPFVSIWQFHTPQCLFQRGLESFLGGESLWWGLQHNFDDSNAFFFYSSICALKKYNTLLHYQAHLTFYFSSFFSWVFPPLLNLKYIYYSVSFIVWRMLPSRHSVYSFLFEAYIFKWIIESSKPRKYDQCKNWSASSVCRLEATWFHFDTFSTID